MQAGALGWLVHPRGEETRVHSSLLILYAPSLGRAYSSELKMAQTETKSARRGSARLGSETILRASVRRLETQSFAQLRVYTIVNHNFGSQVGVYFIHIS